MKSGHEIQPAQKRISNTAKQAVWSRTDHKTSRIFGAFIRTFLSALCSIRPCFTVSLLLYYVTTIILLFYTHNCPIGDYTWSHQHTCTASRETLKEGHNTTELNPFEILWVVRRSVGKAYTDCRYPLGSDYISQ